MLYTASQSRELPAEPLGGRWSGPRGPSTTGRGSSGRAPWEESTGSRRRPTFGIHAPGPGQTERPRGGAGSWEALLTPEGTREPRLSAGHPAASPRVRLPGGGHGPGARTATGTGQGVRPSALC